MLMMIVDAERLVERALCASGVARENARSVAVALVTAEAAGQGGHGLRRVCAYAAQARAGKVDGKAVPQAMRARPGVLLIDAADGFAYPALDLMVELLPDIARTQGIAFCGVRRSHHAGVMGLTVERFAAQGLAAMMFANAPASMAAWGGRRPLYGTNPIAFAVPVAGADPLVIDLALSKVARGKIMTAAQKGEAIPDDWAFDRDGAPTTDAAAAMAGTMAPLGGAKGAALALMVEVLSAGLIDASFSHQAPSLFDDKGGPVGLGHSLIAIDPAATGGRAVERLAKLADAIASEPGVRLPGRRGQGLRREAAERGFEIEDAVIAAIEGLF